MQNDDNVDLDDISMKHSQPNTLDEAQNEVNQIINGKNKAQRYITFLKELTQLSEAKADLPKSNNLKDFFYNIKMYTETQQKKEGIRKELPERVTVVKSMLNNWNDKNNSDKIAVIVCSYSNPYMLCSAQGFGRVQKIKELTQNCDNRTANTLLDGLVTIRNTIKAIEKQYEVKYEQWKKKAIDKAIDTVAAKAIINIDNDLNNAQFKQELTKILLESVDPHNPKIPPQTMQAIAKTINARLLDGKGQDLEDISAFCKKYEQNKRGLFDIAKFQKNTTTTIQDKKSTTQPKQGFMKFLQSLFKI